MIAVSASDFVVRHRPKAYRSDGMTVGGHSGLYLAARPRPYPLTRQQRRVRDVARQCGIQKGMSRSSLRQAMVSCVGPALARNGNGG